jgi:hypothetical protein
MMLAIPHALGMLVADLFKSRRRLEAENLLLRHQLTIALRRAPPRLRLLDGDRALLTWMTRLWPSLLDAVQVVQPEIHRDVELVPELLRYLRSCSGSELAVARF